MKDILATLADSNLGIDNESDFDVVIEKLQIYYSEHKRHKYSEITKYVLDVCKKTNDGEHIEVILDNLSTTINIIESRCVCEHDLKIDECRKLDPPQYGCKASKDGTCYSNMKSVYRKLNKLYDHIYLEFLRIMDIRQVNEAHLAELEDLSLKYTESEKTLKSTTAELRKANIAIDNSQKEYITILGIFASIVLAFTGGIAFSTSVLENIDGISPYRLAAVVIGLAFILINVVYILVWFILEINKEENQKNKYPRFMIVINGILIVAIAVTLCIWCNDSKNQNEEYTNEIDTTIKTEQNKID